MIVAIELMEATRVSLVTLLLVVIMIVLLAWVDPTSGDAAR